MAGHQFSVNLPAKAVAKTAKEVAESLKFRVDETDLFNFRLKKGNFAVSLIAGAFIVYCDFTVELEEDEVGNTTCIMVRNVPWWTGLIGINRVKNAAKSLVEDIADELQESGAIVRNREEFK